MHEAPYRSVPLSGKLAAGRLMLIDEADIHRLGPFKWHVATNGYARRDVSRFHDPAEFVYVHRLVMGLKDGDGKIVDHINRDRLDNRRANLRLATASENNRNTTRTWGSSPYRGVSWDPRRGKWRATGKLADRQAWLGYFSDELEAAITAEAWRREHTPDAPREPLLANVV